MYEAGKFMVLCKTVNGKYYRSLALDTEREARDFGNAQWVKPYVVSVEISRTGFYHKRRHSTVIASASKVEKQ